MSHDYIKKQKNKKTKGLTQLYFILLILKTTHFHIQLITQLQPFLKKRKRKLRHVVLFTSRLHIYHIREHRRERGRKNAPRRDREKAGGDQVSPEGQSRRRSAFTQQQRLVRLPTAAIPPPTARLGQIGLTFLFYFLVLNQLCCYNKK